jgi:hypothetical protein
MVIKMNLLPYSHFFQNFKTLTFLYDLIFHQVHPMNMYFHKKGHVFVKYNFSEINYMILCIPFDSFIEKNILNT